MNVQLSEVKPNHVRQLGDITPLNSPSTLIRSPLHDLADDGFPPSKLYLMKRPGLPGGWLFPGSHSTQIHTDENLLNFMRI